MRRSYHFFIPVFILEVLAEVWSHTVIDQYPVIADYVPSTT
ncbi:unnamed protein product, partial [Rotaria magnacalcarata]